MQLGRILNFRENKMGDNPLLRHQSLTILQQIEELKNWHKQQQSKANSGLKNVYNSNKNDISSDHDAAKHSNAPHSNVSMSPLQNFDEIPIKVTNPNFIDIVENNVPPNETKVENQQATKPKFKFLKRGEGIARFRMGPQRNKKRQKIRTVLNQRNPPLQLTRDPKLSNNTNEHANDKCSNDYENVNNQTEIPPLHPPDLQLDFKDWKSVFSSGKANDIIEKAIDNNKLEIFQPNSSLDSSTVSIMEKLLVAGKKYLKDREELRVFEVMEQHVQDTSFCSTSSYVTKLMENAVMSTPEKIPVLNQNHLLQMNQPNQPNNIVGDESQINHLQTVPEQKQSITPTSTNQENQQGSNHESLNTIGNDELQQSLHVKFSEEIDYRSFVDCSQSVNNSAQKDASRGEEFNDSEEWKQESGDDSTCCSQCSTSYSSSEEDVRAISPPAQHTETFQPDSYNCPRNSQKNKRSGPVEKLLVTDLKTDNDQKDESVSCKNNNLDNFPPILNEKLRELENEIEIFRVENNKLKSIREKLEKEHKTFMLEKKKFIKDLEEEKKDNRAQLEEEKQKLAKEKFIFEKYSKALQKNPSKEERKEIQALREQLSEIKEELNKKESRWGAAQARVRNQVKLLEEDNKKLKGEIDTLTKRAKHLELLAHNKNRKAFNNTKLIHDINNHISYPNLPPQIENEKATIKSNEGYFNTKTSAVKTVVIDKVNPKDCPIKVIDERPKKNEIKINNSDVIHSVQSSSTVPQKGSDEATKLGETSSLVETVQTNEKNIESKQLTNNMQPVTDNQSPNSVRQILNDSGSVETVQPDGKREVRYKNGNVKKVDPMAGTEKTIYYNGDVKETTRDGTVKYYFSESRIWHTTLPDGLEVFDFPNGQVEKRHCDGLVEIVYPNNCKKLNYPDGSEVIYYPDGTSLKTEADKRKILSLPNGQKEIHTDECIRREYPDGTVKIVYADGTTETVYSNGRVRLKDKHGNLVMDSATSTNNRFPL